MSDPAGDPPAVSAPRERMTQRVALAANLGALIGIVLVILQLRQNEALQRAQTRHELATGIVEMLHEDAGNPQLASVLMRGAADERLSPLEQFQFRMRANALLRYWEDAHYQFRQGLYDDAEFAAQTAAWRDSLAQSAGMRRYWCEVRQLYSPAFARRIDSLLPMPCAHAAERRPG